MRPRCGDDLDLEGLLGRELPGRCTVAGERRRAFPLRPPSGKRRGRTHPDDKPRLVEHQPRATEAPRERIAEGEHPQMEAGGSANLDAGRATRRGPERRRGGDSIAEDRKCLLLLRAAGLVDERAKLGEAGRDLGRGDHVETGDENRRLDDGMAGPDMPHERPPLMDPFDPSHESLPLPTAISRHDSELERHRHVGQPPALDRRGRKALGTGPAADDGSGQEEDIVGQLKHPGRRGGEVAGGLARRERLEDECLDPPRPEFSRIDLRPHRRQMRLAVGGAGRDQPFEDHGEQV
jgi:hypothetical protein